MTNKIVYIVHSVDTEGPLYEPVEASFERLEEMFGIDNIEPTKENLKKLQNGEIYLGGLEDRIAEVLKGHLLNYNDTWEKVDEMLKRIMSPEFRMKLPDSFGRGWIFNWHCVDHVGYEHNPRRREMGYLKIFDHYKALIKSTPGCPDAIHWHFHPMSTYREAHRCATSYVNSPELYQILCRRIIEREWFPSVNRAGFHVERPDSNLFLEQWIPFDLSNIAKKGMYDDAPDYYPRDGLDWRRAPLEWSVYHPDYDDYQVAGNCRRVIGRALNVLNRTASIDQDEMDRAFDQASEGKPALVGIIGHDFRDLGAEVDMVCTLIKESSYKYPDVRFMFSEACEGFRGVLWPDGIRDHPLELKLELHSANASGFAYIEISLSAGKVFGPQPFLAIKTKSGKYLHDNLDFSISKDRWFYSFYANTLPLEDVAVVGVGAADMYGNVSIKKLTS